MDFKVWIPNIRFKSTNVERENKHLSDYHCASLNARERSCKIRKISFYQVGSKKLQILSLIRYTAQYDTLSIRYILELNKAPLLMNAFYENVLWKFKLIKRTKQAIILKNKKVCLATYTGISYLEGTSMKNLLVSLS